VRLERDFREVGEVRMVELKKIPRNRRISGQVRAGILQAGTAFSFFHPDCYGRPRNSPDVQASPGHAFGNARGLYHRSGIEPWLAPCPAGLWAFCSLGGDRCMTEPSINAICQAS
jgi:hypothetical protein